MEKALFERLKFARELLGFTSPRSFSIHMGLHSTSWQNYEKGTNFPGSSVLANLLKRGININWLLSGEGQPFLLGEQPIAPVASLGAITQEADERQNISMGLGRLALVAAQHGSLQERLQLMQILVARSIISFADLVESSGLRAETVAALLHELIHSGHVAESDGGYKAIDMAYGQRAQEAADKAQAVLSAVRFITRDVVAHPKKAILVDGISMVRDGQAWVDGIMDFIAQSATAQHDADGQRVRLVVSVMVGENS